LLKPNSNDLNTDLFTKIYLTRKPGDIDYPDSITYYYSRKLKDIPYSFSKELDSVNDAKMYGMKIVYEQNHFGTPVKIIPKRIIEIRFNKIEKIENTVLLNKAFDAFEKMNL
jgi:hypothetical protein